MPFRNRFVVLVVEDDPDHAAFIQAVFAYRPRQEQIHVTSSAEEAIDYLLGKWPFEDRKKNPPPDVIILDIAMPGVGGLAFLEWLRSKPDHGHIPVVVFTGVEEEGLEQRARTLGADEFLRKPDGFTELVDVVDTILERWRNAEEA